MSKVEFLGDEISDLGSGPFSLKNAYSIINNQCIEYSDLKILTYQEAFVIRTGHGFRAFDSELNLIGSSFPLRGGVGSKIRPTVRDFRKNAYFNIVSDGELLPIEVRWEDLSKYKGKIKYESLEDLLYLTPLHNEFGHAITEGLSRFWPFLDEFSDYGGPVFNGPYSKRNEELAKTFWRAVGRQDIYVNRLYHDLGRYDVLKVNNLKIPEAGINLAGAYNIIMKKLWLSFSTLSDFGNDVSKKVYFSRSKIEKRQFVDEAVVENVFVKQGYEIVHPQEMSFDEQVNLVKVCSSLAGLSGSALHLSQFLPPGAKLLALTPSNHIMPDLIPVSKINDFDLFYILSDQNGKASDHLSFLHPGMGVEELHGYISEVEKS